MHGGCREKPRGDVKLRRDLMFVYIVGLVSLSRVLGVKGRVSEQEKNNIIGKGPQQYLLQGGRENSNDQLGYKLHQPLCGSLNDVSLEGSRDLLVTRKNTH